MRQLLIVKSPTSFNTPATPIDNGLASHGVNDLSGLKVGAISFFELGNSVSVHESAPTKNFAIALGRKNNQHPFIIPEVDINTLHVTKALPYKGHQFSVVFTMPTTIVGKEYTLRFYKKGVVPHERNSWTVSIVASTTTAATEATAFKKAMDSKISDKFNLTTSVSTAQITITGNNFEDWEVKAVDSLSSTNLVITNAEKNIGDKAFVTDLASRCAYGKGFADTYRSGDSTIPGYPEDVEDFTLNDSGENRNGTDATNGKYSTSGYAIYTLRFKVGREASKTRDERVWQNVYIAIPVDGNSTYNQITNIDKIIPTGNFMNTIVKTIANTQIKSSVKSESLI